MALEISEDLVSLAYQSLGYFVLEGRKIGRREMDLLAVRLGDDGEVAERLHVEISISVSPAGILRKGSAWATKQPDESAKEWFEQKFEDSALRAEVQKAFHVPDYKKVFVHGELQVPPQLEVLTALGVDCVHIRDLVKRALKEGAENRLHRAVGIAKLLT